MTSLLEPWSYEFFQHGFVVALLAGAVTGLIGTYVVLRGMSYIGHGLSHAVFGGAVVSFVAGVNFYLGAGLWGFLTAAIVGRVARRRTLGVDGAIGVVTTASFALGVAILSRGSGFVVNFEAALFGNVLAVAPVDIAIVAGLGLVVATFVFLGYRHLLFSTFDPDVADASGIATARIDAALSMLLAATVVSTMRVLGVMLIAAALVIPPATARLVTRSFAQMLWASVAIGALSGAAGMYLSWYLDISSGAAIVLAATAVFTAAFVVSSFRPRRAVA